MIAIAMFDQQVWYDSEDGDLSLKMAAVSTSPMHCPSLLLLAKPDIEKPDVSVWSLVIGQH